MGEKKLIPAKKLKPTLSASDSASEQGNHFGREI
jgi:hypothetical protein